MPNFHDHLLAGSMLSAVFIYLSSPYIHYTPGMIVATVAFVLLASIFPDVDHKNSRIHRYLSSFLVLISGSAIAFLAYPDPFRMIASAIITGTGIYLLFELLKPHHRGITHTFKAAVVFAITVAGLCTYLLGTSAPAAFALISYLSHLLLDGTWK